jgi:predicted PurR-regulated permease PerM
MQVFREDRSQKIETLINVFIVLGILLVALAIFALIGDVLGLLDRFRSEIFLFLIGAILAYLMAPLVHVLEPIVRKRWAAVLASYLALFLALAGLAFLLINPFISQAKSLIDNLHNPSSGSLTAIGHIKTTATRIHVDLSTTKPVAAVRADIATLHAELSTASSGATAVGQIKVPPSYITPIERQLQKLISDLDTAAQQSGAIGSTQLDRLVSDSTQLMLIVNGSAKKMSSTPRLLLGLQSWLDRHGFQVDLHDQFGSALQQVSNQVASLVNNALGIALRAGNLLLNTVLILIISIYFVSDGGRFVQWLIGRTPAEAREETQHLVTRLDQILGSYLRTQVLMALLAATLDATGAVVLGVPYPVVIFFSSFLLSLVPVIGPVVLPFPPMLIAVVFAPLPTPVLYLAWLLVGEQLATNVIGPRLQGHSVGIHPLEAMAAALLGFPLAGFLGSFFAVPIVAFLHVVAKEVIGARQRHIEQREA